MKTRIQGYASDCTFEAQLERAEERLRDELNGHDDFTLRDATLTRLSDGSTLQLAKFELSQEEVLAVDAGVVRKLTAEEATSSRRSHTVRHRRRVKVGPYSIVGNLHERPGVAPLGSMRITKPFVVFTEAHIVFQRGASTVVCDMDALIVNGRQIAWLGDAFGPADDPVADHDSLYVQVDAI